MQFLSKVRKFLTKLRHSHKFSILLLLSQLYSFHPVRILHAYDYVSMPWKPTRFPSPCYCPMRLSTASGSKCSLLRTLADCAFRRSALRLLLLCRLALRTSLLNFVDSWHQIPWQKHFMRSKHVASTNCIWDSFQSHNWFCVVLGNRCFRTIHFRIVDGIADSKGIKRDHNLERSILTSISASCFTSHSTFWTVIDACTHLLSLTCWSVISQP